MKVYVFLIKSFFLFMFKIVYYLLFITFTCHMYNIYYLMIKIIVFFFILNNFCKFYNILEIIIHFEVSM